MPGRLPAEGRGGPAGLRLADLWIVRRERPKDDLTPGAGEAEDALGELEERHLLWVAEVDRIVHGRPHEAPEAVDQVGDVLERARLRAVAEDGQWLAGERLRDERGNRAPVVDPHGRAKGVEDAGDPRVHAGGAVVGRRDRLGEGLPLVVTPARADRVHIAPVVLALRVDERVAVDLGGRGEQEPGARGHGEAERVVRAERANLERLDRQLEVVARGGGAPEVPGPVGGPGPPGGNR